MTIKLPIHVSKEDVTSNLKLALIETCDDAFFFSDDETALIDAEYLLTVNSAKSINKLNPSFGYPYKIFLEHDTGLLATACLPLFGKKQGTDFLGYPRIIRKSNNTERVGKVDIAVYFNSGGVNIPFCAIECKGFNPSKPTVLLDLVRNLEFCSFVGSTGGSQMSFTYFVALHSFKKTFDDAKEKKNIEKIIHRYNMYLAQLAMPDQVKPHIDVFTIRRGILPNSDDPDIHMLGLQGDEDYHFLGAMIKFENLNNY